MKVISIGDLVTDFYYKNGKLIGVNGGMTSHNIIANMCSLGWNTEVFGVCGNDSAGHLAIESLKDLGIDVNHVKVLDDINTRCFHVSYIEKDGTLTFSSKKRCPFCGEKRWYANSKIDINDILENIEKDDILVFDNLNVQNQLIIDNTENKKMLDLGQYFELEDYNNQEVINKIQNKFDIINLNERVEKYLKERFSIDTDEELYYLLHTKMIIITRGNRGSDFVYEKGKITKKLTNPETEVDASGAGDGFFSVFISGKTLDSIIIGILCFIFMTILRLPYALLISVIVGVTNMIPYFGPFIGAVPGAFIILLIDPIQMLIYLLLILVLQQFDGLYLGPKILGDSTGLRPIWIIFAITIGGAVGGFIGMFLGVPCVAVIAFLTGRWVENRLQQKSNLHSSSPKSNP